MIADVDDRRDEAGFTLIEVLVAMMLALVIGGIVSQVLITSTRVAAKQVDQTETLNSAKVAMERMTREVRGANSMTTAADRRIQFVATHAGIRTATTLEVVTTGTKTELRQTDQRTDLAAATTTTTTRTILGGLAVGRSDAVFTYTDGAGTPLLPANPAPAPVTYNAGDAKTVGIRVLVRRAGSSPPIELYQLVSIRNLED